MLKCLVEQYRWIASEFTIDYNYIKGERSCENYVEYSDDEEDHFLKNKHILICEDNQINQEVISSILELKGAVTEIAENGEIGLRKFSQSSLNFWDMIFMDIHMPIMDGYTATRAIRNLDRDDAKTVLIIAMTADAFSDDIQKCLDAGMDGHLTKPVDPKQLFMMLKEQLRKKSDRE